jgi:hypothetical protein
LKTYANEVENLEEMGEFLKVYDPPKLNPDITKLILLSQYYFDIKAILG